MADLLDQISKSMVSKLPRREAMKRVAGVVAATAGGLLAGRAAAAGGTPRGPRRSTTVRHAGPTKTLRKVALRVALPSGGAAILHLPDNFRGGLTYKGESATFVPRISESGERVDVSVYRGKNASGSPVRTLELPLADLAERDRAATVAVSLDGIPVAGFAAFWAGATEVPADYTPDCDCSVSCCWGGSDSGCCPGCKPRED
jgi:hypothetical protein